MRNLKRALSLVMAMALIVGMMVVSASAAGKDFTDADEIDHKEAVDVMTALNVISGKEDGSYYDPNGTLTRAEMAKIVAFVMNGGVEPNIGTKLVPTYSDIDNHWAEAYIEYCTSMGIIAGDGAGKFNPQGTLTASQTAKMFLTAMGYNANVFGLLGNDWETNTNRYANEAGLYDELGDVSVSAPITRDDAAQMAYNAIQATMMKRTWNQDLATGEVGETYAPWVENNIAHTLLGEKFNASIEYAYMTDAEYDEDRDQYSYDLDPTANFGAAAIDDSIALSTNITGGSPASDTLIFSEDVSNLYGHQVKIIYKNNAAHDVYGIYAAADSKVLTSGVIGDIPDDLTAADTSAEINDVTYRFRTTTGNTPADVDIYYYLSGNTNVDITGLENKTTTQPVEYTFELIDNDGDNRANCVMVYPFTVEKVTYVGTSSITLDSSVGSKDLEDDINVYEGIAKNDYVARTAGTYTLDGKDSVAKLDVITGTVDAMRDGDEAQIDGVWYAFTDAYTGGTALDEDVNVGDTVVLQVVNGYYVDSEVTLADGTANVLYVSAADQPTTSLGATTAKVNAYFSDGSHETVTVDKVNDQGLTKDTGTKGLASYKPDMSSNYTTATNLIVVGTMYRYTIDADGNYELYALDNDTAVNKANYDRYGVAQDNTIVYTTTTGRLDVNGVSYSIADDTVVFAQTTYDSDSSDGDTTGTRVVSGKALKNWNWTTLNANAAASNVTIQVLAANVNGVNTARLITFVNATDEAVISGADSTAYGYVTAKPAIINNPDGVRSQQFVIWNGTESITVFQDGTGSSIVKGDFVSYEIESADEITNLKRVGTAYAVTGLSSDDTILDLVDEAGKTVDAAKIDEDDTTVIYVDTGDVAGVEGGSVTLANEIAAGRYQMNVWAADKGSGEVIDVIFVDTDNVIAGTTVVTTSTSTVAAGTDIAGIKALEDGVYVPEDIAFITEADSSATTHDPDDILVFKFTSAAASQTVTLYIDAANDNDKDGDAYKEAGTADDGDHYFTVNGAGEYNLGNGTTVTTDCDLTPGATYYFVVEGSIDGVLLRGSFTYNGN